MKAIVVPILVAATAVAISGCTFKSTTVRQADAPPPKVVYVQPAPTVYQPTVYSAPADPTVNVNYTGAGGFDLAAQKAAAYCGERYGKSGARLIRDDRVAGRATFECS